MSTYITVSVTGPAIRGKARNVISSDFVIRRQPMLSSMLVTTMSIEFNLSVVLPYSQVLSALKTDIPNIIN